MDQSDFSPAGNIIPLESKLKEVRDNVRPIAAEAGSKDDPRMKEAIVLMEAFLAIEDPVARNALVTLAQQLVSYDWARRARQR